MQNIISWTGDSGKEILEARFGDGNINQKE